MIMTELHLLNVFWNYIVAIVLGVFLPLLDMFMQGPSLDWLLFILCDFVVER